MMPLEKRSENIDVFEGDSWRHEMPFTLLDALNRHGMNVKAALAILLFEQDGAQYMSIMEGWDGLESKVMAIGMLEWAKAMEMERDDWEGGEDPDDGPDDSGGDVS